MDRLYRSRRNRWISGLIGGLGEYFGISTFALRLLALISIPFTGGTIIFIYFIAALVISKEPYPPQDPYFGGEWQAGDYHKSYGQSRRNYYKEPQYDGGSSYGGAQQHYGVGAAGIGFGSGAASNLDSMMEDIEKKAMKKELEELRKKLSNYEKGEV